MEEKGGGTKKDSDVANRLRSHRGLICKGEASVGDGEEGEAWNPGGLGKQRGGQPWI